MMTAAGSMRDAGMMLPAKAVRPAPEAIPVAGSKTVVPVPLKSPLRMAGVATVRKADAACRRKVRSQSAK